MDIRDGPFTCHDRIYDLAVLLPELPVLSIFLTN